jgi:hypothetical protein
MIFTTNHDIIAGIGMQPADGRISVIVPGIS